MTARICLLACVASAGLVAPARAADITWDGGGDGVNWSDAANWSADTAGDPGSDDVAIFNDAGSATLATTADGPFTGVVQSLRVNQSTATGAIHVNLARSLTLSNNTTALQYNTTSGVGSLAQADDFQLDLNGNDLVFSTGTAPVAQTLLGTFLFDTAGSRLYSNRSQGTGASDTVTLNVGTGTSPARILVTASGSLGHIVGGSPNSQQPTTVQLAATASLEISNNATFTIAKTLRGSNGSNIALSSAGQVSIASGTTLRVLRDATGTATGSASLTLANLAGGVLTHAGDARFETARSSGTGSWTGNPAVTNAGNWIVAGANAAVTRAASGNGTAATTTPTFANTGTLRGDTASDTLDYDGLLAGARMTLTGTGVVSPGAGSAAVGALQLQDIDLNLTGGTLQITLAADASFDVLSLIAGDNPTAGTLTLGPTSTLALTFTGGYSPAGGTSWTILNYGAVSGSFDLPTQLTLAGATGLAADPANYTITYGAGSATLTLIPEPASLALAAAAALLTLPRRRRVTQP